jgi:aldehyde dehydrogenase family 7 member A1
MAVGMSRRIGGRVFPSERPDHFMLENWNPIGIMGVITAFNFPNAVFGWNAAIALMCGNLIMWKGSPSTYLTSIATMKIIDTVFKKNNVPPGVITMLCDGVGVGRAMVADPVMKLISFTGSTWVGRQIATKVAERFGKTLLELGGNNCSIVCEDANLDLAIRGCTFGAVGTSGQRCTTLRRLVIHEKVYDDMKNRLLNAYKTISIGSQLDPKTLFGPVHSKMIVDIF